MNQPRRKRRAEALRNRILLLLFAVLAVLTVAILVTAPQKKTPPPPQPAPSGESPPAPVVSTPSPESAAQPESASPSGTAVPPPESAAPSPPPSASPESGTSSQPGSAPADPADPYYEAAKPLLVNPTNKIPEDFRPDVAEMGNGYSYDKKALIAYNALLQKAQKDGISLWVVSAYRSFEKQTTNFNNKIKEYESLGYTATQAYAATAQLIAVPGTSEHSLGLALDLNSLETSFENTKAFAWLLENCADFGFILRYPKDKTEITEISYEPWHYRYVGSNHARIIMEKGICLEEYLSGDY